MTTEARKRVLRYAIAADLVILVTGVGLLFPAVDSNTLVLLYMLAVAGAAWKGGGWRGSLLAMLLSLVAAYFAFGTMDLPHAGILAAVSLVIAAIAGLMAPPKPPKAPPKAEEPKTAPAAAAPLAPVLTFERNGREPEEKPAAPPPPPKAESKPKAEPKPKTPPPPPQPPAPSLFARLAAWMRPSPKKPPTLDLTAKKAAAGTGTRAPAPGTQKQPGAQGTDRVAPLAMTAGAPAPGTQKQPGAQGTDRVAPLAMTAGAPAPGTQKQPGAQGTDRVAPLAMTAGDPAPGTRDPQQTTVYTVPCFSCRVAFDVLESDWCSCLTSERTLVCTNCLTCFCKAPPSYGEKFWMNAPPRLFERKRAERPAPKLVDNPPPDGVIRPLVLLVVSDAEIEVIVQRICNNLGYGFVCARDGAEGLEIARTYRPNLILADAFLPKLDGREMCRVLKEEAAGHGGLPRTVVMTGLYTDAKYRSEALARFHIDDYLFKPVSITDLINLLQKDLEGVKGLPAQEDLYALHRKDVRALDAPAVDADTVARLERELIGAMRIANEGSDPALKARRPLVLLVEDDENVQLIVRTVVSKLGYGFIAAANAQEGRAAAREHRPDLVIAEAFRPALGGRELFQQLKSDPATAKTKAILMTGLPTASDSIAKPLAVEDLVRLLKKHLPSDVRPAG